MSPIGSEHFQSKRQDLRRVFDRLNAWIESNPRARYLDPRLLNASMRDVPFGQVLVVLSMLAAAGVLHQFYKAVHPKTEQLVGRIEEDDPLPTTVSGGWDGQAFEVDETDLLPVFEEAGNEPA